MMMMMMFIYFRFLAEPIQLTDYRYIGRFPLPKFTARVHGPRNFDTGDLNTIRLKFDNSTIADNFSDDLIFKFYYQKFHTINRNVCIIGALVVTDMLRRLVNCYCY